MLIIIKIHWNFYFLPIIKKFPGSCFSSKLLYDKSNTSNTGKAPNPLGSVFKRFIETFKILNLGIDDKESGSSLRWLFDKFKISKFGKLAIPGGRTENN